jgi:zinc transport system substrate-binding protein
MKHLIQNTKVAGALLLMLGIQGCDQQPSQTSNISGKEINRSALIMTVSEPIRFMAERITDNSWATIEFPADASVADPAYWKPNPETIRRYQEADLILLNGGGYAKWTQGASLKISRLHDTSTTFKDRFILAEDAVVHQHGPEGTHSHEGYATTTWLDFELAGLHADAVFEALKNQWPEHEDAMQKNQARLKDDLNKLHRDMLAIANQIGTTPLLASHPVYQYPAKAYGLNIHSLHWEPNATPGESEWQALDVFLASTPTQWMIWEDTPTDETQNQLSQRKIKWVVFRPQGGVPASGNFLSSMKANLEALRSLKQ